MSLQTIPADAPAKGPATTSWQRVAFDRELILKYDRPGPRYTSYPTAPHFVDDFGPDDYRRLLAASAGSGKSLSLYFHLPFCETLCFYCGCNMLVARDRQRSTRYLGFLEREMAQVAERLGTDRRDVVQIHLGGGTPTFHPPEDLTRLMAGVRRLFRLHEDCEIGVEVDPRTCTPAHLDALAEAGFNRLSMGLQDLDPAVQKAVNRIQSEELTRGVIDGAHARGIHSVNIDLIYGLPFQTLDSFRTTVERAIAMDPDRFAVFNFAYLPSVLRHQKVIDESALPSTDEKLSTLEMVISTLTGAGYGFIGMDHFAKPDDPLSEAQRDGSLTRNFQGYSTWGDTDLVGFGASSIGQVGGGYAQNRKTVKDYETVVDGGELATCRGLVTTGEDHLRSEVIIELMCHSRLDMDEVGERHGVDFRRHFADELERLRPMAEDGLVEIAPDRLTVTPLGRLLVRNVAMVFDAYLGRKKAVFSRTV